MAISIDWTTFEIYIPQSYLTSLGGTAYQLNIETLRNDLKNIEDSDEGMPFSGTHNRNAPSTLSGVTYAQTFEVIAPYTITFENTGTPYVVSCVGANHNLADVTNFDGGMSLIIGNSAGLQVVSSGSGMSTEEHDKLMALPSSTDVTTAVFDQADLTPIASNMKQTNDEALIGTGAEGDRFRSHLVPVDIP